jgi:hypothetical protein
VDGPPAAPAMEHFYGAALISISLMIASLFVLFRVRHVGMDFIRRCVRPRAINALVREGSCDSRAGSPEGSPTRKLIFADIFGWAQGAEVGMLAFSLGERVASVASQVRGYLVMLAHLIPPRRATDPSPGPRRLVKAPAAVHPLPSGEGKRRNPLAFPRGKRPEARCRAAVSSEREG